MYTWPRVSINGEIYHGSHTGENIIEAICSSLTKPTKECIDIMQASNPNFDINSDLESSEESSNVALIVTIVVLILLVIFCLIFFQYRRQVLKELNQEMNS